MSRRTKQNLLAREYDSSSCGVFKFIFTNLIKVKVPFEPSMLAQIAGNAAIDDEQFLAQTITLNKEGVRYFSEQFNQLKINFIYR